MRYLSVCSGIEAATVAWHPLGWTAAAYSEIEKFPSQVLAHHYPKTPNVGDMTKFKEWNIGSIDLLVGGTPCQSFSVAGLRKGLDDPRGNLMLTYLAIADQYRPRWLVWENVPGVLSSNGGKDFGVFLGALGELGYGFAYRILDAQYFGVAQRRRRVFVVGYLGDWRAAAAVLFERHSLSGDSAPSREKRKEAASGITHGLGDGGECARALTASNSATGRLDPHESTYVSQPIPFDTTQITSKANYSKPESGDPCHPLAAGAHPPAIARPIPFGVSEKPDVGHCLRFGASKADKHESTTYVAQPISFSGQMSYPQTDIGMTQTLQAKNPMAVVQPVYELHSQDSRVRELNEVCTTVSATYGTGGGNIPITLMQAMAVRRLTPVECERLQGFPDNYTNIPWRKAAESPDGPRYKALGNSWAVPVVAWIGQRIQDQIK